MLRQLVRPPLSQVVSTASLIYATARMIHRLRFSRNSLLECLLHKPNFLQVTGVFYTTYSLATNILEEGGLLNCCKSWMACLRYLHWSLERRSIALQTNMQPVKKHSIYCPSHYYLISVVEHISVV